MQNQQGLNINELDKNEQNQIRLTGQVEVNPQFEHNQEQKFDGFDFGLSQGDWGIKDMDNNVNESIDCNVSEIEEIKKDEFEYDFTPIDNNNAIDNNNNANSSTQTNDKHDQFQTFQQQTNNQLYQSSNKASFFIDQNQENNQSEQMVQKRLKLQSLYKISKSRSLLNKKTKQQSQLEQLVKYNRANNNINIYTNANRNTKTKLYSNNMNNNNNNKMQSQQQQRDFFSLTQSQSLKQQQYQQEENEFAVFDRPSLFGNKQYQSTYVQQYHSTYVQQQKEEVNSPSNLLYNNHHDNNEMSNNFQTQILLSPYSGIMQSTQQGQYNPAQIKDNKIFSIKFLPRDLLITRLIISIVSITSIALLYGFMNCIFLFIVHDFLVGALLIKQVMRTKTIKNRKNTIENRNNYVYIINNTKSVHMNQQLSLNDQLEIPPSQIQQQQFRTKILNNFDQYKSQLQQSMKCHKYLQYSLYISSISMFIFILVQITQLDTFFTASYFSLSNWAHIIIISIIYTLQLWSNYKLNKKVYQVMFYQGNYLKSYQSQS